MTDFDGLQDAFRRYHEDAEFHARVFTAAKITDLTLTITAWVLAIDDATRADLSAAGRQGEG